MLRYISSYVNSETYKYDYNMNDRNYGRYFQWNIIHVYLIRMALNNTNICVIQKLSPYVSMNQRELA